MKLKVMAERGELRDYFDVKAIDEEGGVSVEEGIDLYMRRYRLTPPAAHCHICTRPWATSATRVRRGWTFDRVGWGRSLLAILIFGERCMRVLRFPMGRTRSTWGFRAQV